MDNSNISAISIPGYKITEVIHISTRSSVYRCEQEKTQTQVIIKTLNAQYPQLKDLISIKNQFAICQNLDHPNIIKCYDLISYRNSLALIIEDVNAISLHEYANSQPLEIENFYGIAINLTKALEYLYQQQVIHKDIKPKNIIINPKTKEVKLIDFSISCLLPKEVSEIKNPNVLEGTLPYMSPEQTGRMNRGIDYRTDFYSLGVTFYQLLTGQLPFISEDPLELVHCHIAKTPIHPQTINPQIDQNLAKIILKLMAKMPEDRYQSAQGIRYDLEKSREALVNNSYPVEFELGQTDKAAKFLISEKIYGRDQEIATLLQSFARVSQGAKELMLVSGFSGVGKTSVINEIHKPIVQQKGYFTSGKYDQFQWNIPFSALLASLQNLCKQLLTENVDKLQTWKDRILAALGKQAQVIIDVIPELENLVGKQPAVPELTGSAAQNRFNLLFSKFIQAIATQESPLVIFIDDLQWADIASLKLIELLISESNTKYLLLIGAYRDNEVYPGHPLLRTLDNIHHANITINKINLQPLNISCLNQYIADTLLCYPSQAIALTKILFSKTQGNPFFTNQLMKYMSEDGVISFNLKLGYWQYDIYATNFLYQSNDVIKFLKSQIIKLPDVTQDVLKIAACIGNKFDLHTLSIVCEKSSVEVATDLWKALKQGVILPEDESYKVYAESNYLKTLDLDQFEKINIRYKFIHDSLQQAAYLLIPPQERLGTHLKIGKLILKNTNLQKLEEIEKIIFKVVNQINIGINLIDDQLEKYELAKLNLIAGRKAKSSTAYDSASKYLKRGLELLAENSWKTNYQLTLNLYTEAVEVEFLNINFEQAQFYIEIVKSNASNVLDQAPVYQVEIQIYMAELQIQLAIETGLNFLQMLGINLERKPPANLNIEELINLPVMTAPEKIAAMEILILIFAPACFAESEIALPTLYTMVELSRQYGNSPMSIYAYAVYANNIASVILDIDTAYQLSQVALKLLDKLNAKDFKSKAFVSININISYKKQHIQTTINNLHEAIDSGLEVGDIEFACHAANFYCSHLFFSGKYLDDVAKTQSEYINFIDKFKQQHPLLLTKICTQAVDNLINTSVIKYELTGDIFNEEESLPYLLKNNNLISLFDIHFYKLFLCYLFGEYQQAVEFAETASKYSGFIISEIIFTLHNWFYSLALLANNSQNQDQKKYLQQVEENQKVMKYWAEQAPMNFQHKYNLVEAETARVLGNKLLAMDLYDLAIAGAKENQFIQDEALANELAARFYLNSGKFKIAQTYLIDAYYCYLNWGAIAKVKDLEIKYYQLLEPILKQKIVQNKAPDLISKIISDSSSNSASAILDLETVTQASLAIASEIYIDNLLDTLLQVIVQNIGAEKALLFFQEDEKLILASQWMNNQNSGLQFILVDQKYDFPFGIINYVKNTGESLLINDASNEKIFANDSYIIKHQVKSIICHPILNQGHLIGIIYLENNLTSGAFTSERLKVLQILSAQAAISIKNARLYISLEEKVAERTQQLHDKNIRLEKTLNELKVTQLQLIQTEKMSSLGQMVAGIAHEINNPINFIYANVDYAKDYINALIELSNLYQQEYPEASSVIKKKIAEIDLDFLISDLPKLLDSMAVGAERIRQIVLGLRNFSRLDESEMKAVDIHLGIDSTLMLLLPRFKEKLGILQNIVIKNYGELPLVTCYASQLNQVFMNIISNGIDALHTYQQSLSKESKEDYLPQLTISTTVVDKNWVKISIKDNGMGISSEVKNKIFDPFFTTKPVGEGTGLGLSISYQIIVDQHGGRLDCISEPGMGTEFIIEIPITLSKISKISKI
ncbi:MAG: GAF domain-containing protein [Nostocales cyanobacterium]|nr:MAG: GAF domain-containing protein [Nostocales cyanobacterium]